MIKLVALFLTGLLAALSVFLHYEALRAMHVRLTTVAHHRAGVLWAMLGLLVVHTVEIWLFALGFYGADAWLGLGGLTPAPADIFDYVYYSAMVYTTVGFGDLVPSGGLQMMTSGEALCGLSLITWSASFTFLQMQRLWQK